MPFSLAAQADAPPPVIRFGGLLVPTRPFALAHVEGPARAGAVVGDLAHRMARQAGIAEASDGEARTAAIGRVLLAAQEDVFAAEPSAAARHLAGIHWGLEQDVQSSRQDRLAAQTGLLEVARLNGLDEPFRMEVRRAAARDALAAVSSPDPRIQAGLLAAGRGDPEASAALMRRNPRLHQAVVETARQGGVGGGGLFLTSLQRRIESGVEHLEQEFAGRRLAAFDAAVRDPGTQAELDALASRRASGADLEPAYADLARRSPDLARVAREAVLSGMTDLPGLLHAGPDGPVVRERRLLEAESRVPTMADLATARETLARPDARVLVEGAASGDVLAGDLLRAASPWLAAAVARAEVAGRIRPGLDPLPGLARDLAQAETALAARTDRGSEAR